MLTVATAVMGAFGLVLQTVTSALLYLDARMRTEGFDLTLARYVDERQRGVAVADPFPSGGAAQAPGARMTPNILIADLVPIDIPVDPDDENARRWLEEELGRGDQKPPEPAEPSAVVDRLSQLAARPLRRRRGAGTRPGTPTPVAPSASWSSSC